MVSALSQQLFWCRQGRVALESPPEKSRKLKSASLRRVNSAQQGWKWVRKLGGWVGITFAVFLHPGTQQAAHTPLMKNGNL